MPDEPDMTAPVTRREMNEALEIWGGAIIEKLTKRIGQSLRELEARLTAQLASWSTANRDDITRAIRAIDDKYQDIPIRVTRLENKVFAPKRRRPTAARRKRS